MPARPLPLILLLAAILCGPVSPARAAMLDAALATVFTVSTAGDEDRFLGSAFLWDKGEVAVTAAHVVGSAAEVRLTDASGQSETARVIARDAVRDVAVLAVAPGRPGLHPGPEPVLGAPVMALGAPLDLGLAITGGIVSALGRQVEPMVPIRLIQHDAAVNPGSSGGPLIDDQGRLIGLNSRIPDGSRLFIGIAYAIPVSDLARIVTGLIADTLIPVPDLGLRLRPVTRQIAAALGVPPGGVLIDAVAPGSRAADAGLRPGDTILSCAGARVTTPGDLAFAIDAALPQGEALVTLRRDGADIAVILGLAPAARLPQGADALRPGGYSLAALGIHLGEGAVVAALSDTGPARFTPLAPGDRILRLNGAATDLAALRGLILTAPALLLVQRSDGSTRHVLLDPWATGSRLHPVGGANVLDPAVVVF